MKSFQFIPRALPIAYTACIVTLLSVLWCPRAHAGDTLDKIRMRGELWCGVCDNQTGFAAQDAHGRWNGIDADFCRALAAAALSARRHAGRRSARLPLPLRQRRAAPVATPAVAAAPLPTSA